MQLFDLGPSNFQRSTHECGRTYGWRGARITHDSLTRRRSSALKWGEGDCGCPASHHKRVNQHRGQFSGAWRAAISAVTPPKAFAPASTVVYGPPTAVPERWREGLAAGVRQCRAPAFAATAGIATRSRALMLSMPSTATGATVRCGWRRQWRHLPQMVEPESRHP